MKIKTTFWSPVTASVKFPPFTGFLSRTFHKSMRKPKRENYKPKPLLGKCLDLEFLVDTYMNHLKRLLLTWRTIVLVKAIVVFFNRFPLVPKGDMQSMIRWNLISYQRTKASARYYKTRKMLSETSDKEKLDSKEMHGLKNA